MFPIKNDLKSTNSMCTDPHKIFPCIASYRGGGFLKRILTYLYFTKDNEISIRHLDVQYYTSCKKWYK